MKLQKIEYGVIFIPETDFEKECLAHIAEQTLTSQYQDRWNQTGYLKIEFKPHPWDRK